MVAKKYEITTGFRKRQVWNIFHVFEDTPRSKQATIEMKALCDKFAMDFVRVSNKYSAEGLSDSASRDMVIQYILEKLEPWRKTHRIRAESGMKPLPYRK